MSTILVTGARAPAALWLARCLAEAGHHVYLADCLETPVAKASRCIAGYWRLPPPNTMPEKFAHGLSALCHTIRPSHVIPTCEEVFYLAWAFEHWASNRPQAFADARLVAPPLAELARAHNKARFARNAAAFGLTPPDTVEISQAHEVDALRDRADQLVFKPVWSRFAARVLIAPDNSQLDALVRELNQNQPDNVWVAQERITGEELCAYAIADKGRLCALSSYRPTHRAGRGAGIHFSPVCDLELQTNVKAYIRATQWTGQIAFDFRRDETGRLRVLECNPRSTSGVHFFGPGAALAQSLLHGTPSQPNITHSLMIPAAMLVYELWSAIKNGRIGPWLHAFRSARNAMSWPADPVSMRSQITAIAELLRIAQRDRTTLIEASTHGISWDGKPLPTTHANAMTQTRDT